ncbi:MAG: TonB-dependent receptor, partial [Acidobacteriota bacterium]
MTRKSEACVVRTFGWTLRGLVLSVILFSASLAAAQLTRGTITGTVTDQSGAAVPGAAITITHVDTGIARQAETGANGRYEAPNLSVGNYEVRATLAGFQTSVRTGIELTVGRHAVVDHVLQVGEVAQAVTVTGEVAYVETTSATVSNLVDAQQVADLPLNNRDLTQLTFLQPGVLKIPRSGTQSSFSGMGDVLTVAGARATHNLYLLDGVSNGDISNNAQSASGAYAGAETVQEFQIITNNYSAEYQSAAGAIVSAITKSGSNALHGSLFEFLRNDNLDAARWEDNAFGGEKGEFKRNQFGGSLGGPIVPDRTFFFTSYEGLRERLTETLSYTVPSLEVHEGIIDGEFIGVDPKIAPYLALFPLPGAGGNHPNSPLGGPLAGGGQDIIGPANTPTDDDFFAVKIDHNLSDNHQLSGTYNFNDTERLGPCGAFCEVSNEERTGTGLTSIKHTVGFGLTSILSPTTLNEFHFGFSKTRPEQDFALSSIIQDTAPLAFTPTRPFVGAINIDAPALTEVGFGSDGVKYLQESLTFKDGLSLSRGNHSFRLGTEVTHFLYDQRSCSNSCPGIYRFSSLEDFLENKVRRFEAMLADSETGLGITPPHVMNQWMFGAYFQDNWQLKPSFTLNLGLRYEFVTVIGGKDAKLASLRDFNDTETVVGPPSTNATKKSFSPRIGFAWAPGDRKTSLRGGFGIFYIHPRWYHFRTGIQILPPFTQVKRLDARRGNIRRVEDADGNPIKLLFPNAFAAGQFDLVGKRLNIRGPQFNAETMYNYRWSLTLQREVADWVLSAGYTGSRALHLLSQHQINMNRWLIKESRDPNSTTVGAFPDNPVPGQYKYWPAEELPNGDPNPDFDEDIHGEELNPNFAQFRMQLYNGNSYFHGLSMGAQKRLSRGLQLQMSYNFSKLIDQGSGVTNNGDELNQGQRGIYAYDMYMKKGPSIINVPHSFVSNFSYELPRGDFGGIGNAILNGWQFNGVVTLTQGGPMSVFDETDQREDLMQEAEDARPDLRPGFSNNPTEGVSAGCEGGESFAGRKLGTPDLWYDPCAFMPALPGFFGTLGKNTIRSPGVATFDWSVFKNFDITETSRIQFRAEFFNLFNRPNFHLPENSGQNFSSDSERDDPIYRPDAGQIRRTRTSARQIQFALKYIF